MERQMTMQYDIVIIQAAISVRIAYLPHDLFFAEIPTSHSAVNSIISLSPLPRYLRLPPFSDSISLAISIFLTISLSLPFAAEESHLNWKRLLKIVYRLETENDFYTKKPSFIR